jgi:glycerol-3-phosphate dehydrogenase
VRDLNGKGTKHAVIMSPAAAAAAAAGPFVDQVRDLNGKGTKHAVTASSGAHVTLLLLLLLLQGRLWTKCAT